MLFPTIEEYKDAIRIAEHSLATLQEYEVMKTAAGEPWFSSGNFAVVFKMKHRSTGKLLALKCFTRFQERRQESYQLISQHLGSNTSSYLLHYNYLPKEIWAAGAEYPVVAMEWADGATLGDYVKEQCRLNNRANLQALARNFEALTALLITQPFAHGDLKPDNIIVRRDGSLALVDYDGMFIPTMQGQQAREGGSAVYRHPKRTIDTFDRYIDDFSLMVLLLELRLIAADTGHYSSTLSGDSIVAKSGDWDNVGSSRIYQALQAQCGVDWANWAAMLLLLPKSDAYHMQDWTLLIDMQAKPIMIPNPVRPPKPITPPDKVNISGTPVDLKDPFVGQMVFVQGGTFMMGSKKSKNEKPIHKVELDSFIICKYQVTQAIWKLIMGDNPSFHKGDNLPVEQVTWNDVSKFIQKLNGKTGKKYRLPTEAEWEFAARGGTLGQGHEYSGNSNIDQVAWFKGNSNNKTQPVGHKSPNALGIYDMSGNVWEWCNDWYGFYQNTSQTNPAGPNIGFRKVGRGGSFCDVEQSCRVYSRDYGDLNYRSKALGFRLAI